MINPENIDNKEVKNLEHLFKFLIRLSDDGVTPLIEKQVKIMLDQSLYFFAHLILEDCFPDIQRLTINKSILGSNKRIHDIKFLKYPPAEKVTKYGRCNLPGQSILYACFSPMTALNELKPRKGDLITTSKWRVKNDQTLKYCPIFKNQPFEEDVINPRTYELNQLYEKKLKDYPTNLKKQIDLLVKFVADCFTKRINKANHLDYIFSAYFSDKILNIFEEGTVETIYYPSVQEKLSFENLAIKPEAFDKKYELIEVKESVVDMDPSNGRRGYIMLGLSDCNSFDYSLGKILWDKDNIKQPKEVLDKLKRDYKLNLT